MLRRLCISQMRKMRYEGALEDSAATSWMHSQKRQTLKLGKLTAPVAPAAAICFGARLRQRLRDLRGVQTISASGALGVSGRALGAAPHALAHALGPVAGEAAQRAQAAQRVHRLQRLGARAGRRALRVRLHAVLERLQLRAPVRLSHAA